MGKIESIKFSQAQIILDDSRIRLLTKYKGVYCSEIKIWKLPKSNNLFSMFNRKNIFWEARDDSAKFLQGWFHKESDLTAALAGKIEKCSNEADLKRLCLNFESIIEKGSPLDINNF